MITKKKKSSFNPIFHSSNSPSSLSPFMAKWTEHVSTINVSTLLPPIYSLNQQHWKILNINNTSDFLARTNGKFCLWHWGTLPLKNALFPWLLWYHSWNSSFLSSGSFSDMLRSPNSSLLTLPFLVGNLSDPTAAGYPYPLRHSTFPSLWHQQVN